MGGFYYCFVCDYVVMWDVVVVYDGEGRYVCCMLCFQFCDQYFEYGFWCIGGCVIGGNCWMGWVEMVGIGVDEIVVFGDGQVGDFCGWIGQLFDDCVCIGGGQIVDYCVDDVGL